MTARDQLAQALDMRYGHDIEQLFLAACEQGVRILDEVDAQRLYRALDDVPVDPLDSAYEFATSQMGKIEAWLDRLALASEGGYEP